MLSIVLRQCGVDTHPFNASNAASMRRRHPAPNLIFTLSPLAQAAPMTQPRSQLVDLSQAGMFHSVSRSVRRSWLCSLDKYLSKSFEHRKFWVEARILELGQIFACGVHAWAVMSNHLHIVVHMSLRAGKVAGSHPRASAFFFGCFSAQPSFARNFVEQIFWLYGDLIQLRSPAG